MRVAQATQVIPSIGISICLRLGGFKVIPRYLLDQHIPHRGICQLALKGIIEIGLGTEI